MKTAMFFSRRALKQWSSAVKVLAAVGVAMVAAIAPKAMAQQGAEWVVSEVQDAMTDAVVRTASTRNSAGDGLVLVRRQDGSLWLSFHQSADSSLTISSRRTLIYRVDKNAARDAASFTHVVWGSRVAAVQIKDGAARAPGLEAVNELLAGHRLLVRYRNVAGELIDTEFALTGLSEAAAQFLDIAEIKAGAEMQARRREIRIGCMANAVKEDYSSCMRNAGLAP